MRILWVKAGKLLPVDTGGKIRSFNILKHLQAQHDIGLLSYYGGQRDRCYEEEIVRSFPGAMPMWTAALDHNQLWRALDYISQFPSGMPYAVAKFTSSMVQRKIEELFEQRRFDVAVCDFLSASLNFPPVLSTPSVLFQHNVEAVLWHRMASTESNRLKKWLYGIEAQRMQRYEAAAIRRFSHVVAVSEEDRNVMSRYVPLDAITKIPTGVDLTEYRPSGEATPSEGLIVFTGSMDFIPNVDGIEYFCREVWPRVTECVPYAHLRIVGRNPLTSLKKLISQRMEITGWVPSVREHLQEAAVVIVPLRMGGGTRLKIYEAMAMGKAVVSTSVGAEGLEVCPGRDILIANTASEFANSVVDMLKNPDLRKNYEIAAACTASRFDWSVIAQSFVDVLADAVCRQRRGDGVGAMQ